jgi:hypothetical protein
MRRCCLYKLGLLGENKSRVSFNIWTIFSSVRREEVNHYRLKMPMKVINNQQLHLNTMSNTQVLTLSKNLDNFTELVDPGARYFTP